VIQHIVNIIKESLQSMNLQRRITHFLAFIALSAGAAYGQTITPAKLPSTVGCSLPPAASTTMTCLTFGSGFSQTLSVSPAPSVNAPTWIISSGFMPQGLILDQTGTISGAASSGGVFTFTISAVYPDVNIIVTSPTYTVAVQARPLTISQLQLQPGFTGVPITPVAYTASGGYPFIDNFGNSYYQWSFGPGTNSDGLTIDPRSGIVSGIPINPGTFAVTIGAIDALGQGAIFRTAITVTGNSVVSITTTSPLPAGSVGTLYSQTLTASGGVTPYTWTLVSGALPAGLSLTTTGVLSGTPTSTGTLLFSVNVSDANGSGRSQQFSLTINPSSNNFSSALRIAQIVDGGGWTTLFAIQNLDATSINYSFNFWADNGTAWPIPILNGQPGVVVGTLAPGSIAYVQTQGSAASATQGWAEIASSGHVGVEAIFKYSPSASLNSQGTFDALPSSSSVYLPFDNTAGYTTGIAVANANATQSLQVTLTITTDTGSASSQALNLAPHSHTAFVMSTQYPGTAGTRGSIRFTASTPDIAVSGFRYTPSLSFTSLDPLQ
jgi:large repetitive protein